MLDYAFHLDPYLKTEAGEILSKNACETLFYTLQYGATLRGNPQSEGVSNISSFMSECQPSNFVQKLEELKTLFALEVLLTSDGSSITDNAEEVFGRYHIAFHLAGGEVGFLLDANMQLLDTGQQEHDDAGLLDKLSALKQYLAKTIEPSTEHYFQLAQMLKLENAAYYVRAMSDKSIAKGVSGSDALESMIWGNKLEQDKTTDAQQETQTIHQKRKTKSTRKNNREKKSQVLVTKKSAATAQDSDQASVTLARERLPDAPRVGNLCWAGGSLKLWEAGEDVSLPTRFPAEPARIAFKGLCVKLSFESLQQDVALVVGRRVSPSPLAAGGASVEFPSGGVLNLPFTIDPFVGLILNDRDVVFTLGQIRYKGPVILIENKQGNYTDLKLSGFGQLEWAFTKKANQKRILFTGNFEPHGTANIVSTDAIANVPEDLQLDWRSFLRSPLDAVFKGAFNDVRDLGRYVGAFDLVPLDGYFHESFELIPSDGQMCSTLGGEHSLSITRVDPKSNCPGFTLSSQRKFENGLLYVTYSKPADTRKQNSMVEVRLQINAVAGESVSMVLNMAVHPGTKVNQVFTLRDYVELEKGSIRGADQNARIKFSEPYDDEDINIFGLGHDMSQCDEGAVPQLAKITLLSGVVSDGCRQLCAVKGFSNQAAVKYLVNNSVLEVFIFDVKTAQTALPVLVSIKGYLLPKVIDSCFAESCDFDFFRKSSSDHSYDKSLSLHCELDKAGEFSGSFLTNLVRARLVIESGDQYTWVHGKENAPSYLCADKTSTPLNLAPAFELASLPELFSRESVSLDISCLSADGQMGNFARANINYPGGENQWILKIDSAPGSTGIFVEVGVQSRRPDTTVLKIVKSDGQVDLHIGKVCIDDFLQQKKKAYSEDDIALIGLHHAAALLLSRLIAALKPHAAELKLALESAASDWASSAQFDLIS